VLSFGHSMVFGRFDYRVTKPGKITMCGLLLYVQMVDLIKAENMNELVNYPLFKNFIAFYYIICIAS